MWRFLSHRGAGDAFCHRLRREMQAVGRAWTCDLLGSRFSRFSCGVACIHELVGVACQRVCRIGWALLQRCCAVDQLQRPHPSLACTWPERRVGGVWCGLPLNLVL